MAIRLSSTDSERTSQTTMGDPLPDTQTDLNARHVSYFVINNTLSVYPANSNDPIPGSQIYQIIGGTTNSYSAEDLPTAKNPNNGNKENPYQNTCNIFRVRNITETMVTIQDSCQIHSNKQRDASGLVNKPQSGSIINTLNSIYQSINNEIENRGSSQQYYNINNIVNTIISSDQLSDINTTISNLLAECSSSFEFDSNTNLSAKLSTLSLSSIDIEKESIVSANVYAPLSANVKLLMEDCICYSDCNSYSVCYCYGNCNNY